MRNSPSYLKSFLEDIACFYKKKNHNGREKHCPDVATRRTSGNTTEAENSVAFFWHKETSPGNITEGGQICKKLSQDSWH